MNPAANLSIKVTASQLKALAECASRMTEYEKPENSLLIATLSTEDNTPLRVILDRTSICNSQRPENTKSIQLA